MAACHGRSSFFSCRLAVARNSTRQAKLFSQIGQISPRFIALQCCKRKQIVATILKISGQRFLNVVAFAAPGLRGELCKRRFLLRF